MRERIRDLERLHHIDECIDNVMAFLKDKTFEEMEEDKMCFHAVKIYGAKESKEICINMNYEL